MKTYITANNTNFGLKVKNAVFNLPVLEFEKRRWKIVEYPENTFNIISKTL